MKRRWLVVLAIAAVFGVLGFTVHRWFWVPLAPLLLFPELLFLVDPRVGESSGQGRLYWSEFAWVFPLLLLLAAPFVVWMAWSGLAAIALSVFVLGAWVIWARWAQKRWKSRLAGRPT